MENIKDYQKQIRKIVSALNYLAKAKTLFEQAKWLDKTKHILSSTDFAGILEAISDKHTDVNDKIKNLLRTRREDFIKKCSENQIKIERVDSYDRFDVLKIEYKGNDVIISFSNIKMLKKTLSTGDEVYLACIEILDKLRSSPFDRSKFFSRLQLALKFMKSAEPDAVTNDGSVVLKKILIFLQMAIHYEKNKKTLPYELAQFIYDLGRFISKGVVYGNYRIELETPAHAFVKEALIIPNLDNPTFPGRPVRKIRITRYEEKER